MTACPNCRSVNADGANFCSVCGTRLTTPDTTEIRKTVSIVFCDVTGSTELGERLDPESMRKVMSRYFDAMRAALEHHSGSVEKFIGDAVMAVFGVPQLHEDDALRAVRAAFDMRVALDELNADLERDHGVRLACRIGINTGEVLVGAEGGDVGRVTGDAVNTAARLETAAEPGEILIGEATFALVRGAVDAEPVEPMSLKGKAEAVRAYRLTGVLAGTALPPRALRSAMVGRDRELDDLLRAFTRAAEDRTCVLFTILGAAGEGKSRLVEEFFGRIEGSTSVVTGRCLPYGEGITYWPAAEAIRAALGVQAFDDPTETAARLEHAVAGDEHAGAIAGRLAEILGTGVGAGSAEETPWAIRRFLEILSARRPLVVVWEDIHWAEPAFLDVVNHIADWSRDAPIFMLCTARPEFLDTRSDWGGGKLNATTLLLQPLDAKASTELIGNLLGGSGLPSEASERITDAAGGNPLFVEQMLSMMIDDGQLIRQNGGWAPVGDLSSVSVPPSVAALLAARLERLSDAERRAIESASVVGREFYGGAVRDLLPEDLHAETDELIRSLIRKELVRPDRSTVPGEEAYRFRHILIRDAAYQAIPKERRADLHERFAAWIGRVGGERAEEVDEIIGYHLEQAFRYREDLGPVDEEAQALARQAFERLAAAGRRAQGRHDRVAEANLFGRAESLLDPTDPERLLVLPDLGIALWEIGRIDDSHRVLDEAVDRAHTFGDPVMEAHASLARGLILGELERPLEQIRAAAESTLPVLEDAGDDRGLARAWHLIASVEWDLGQAGKQLAALERALDHASWSGWTLQTAEILLSVTSALVRGPMPVPDAIARAEEILEDYPSNRAVQSYMLHALAHLRARLGEFDAARDACDGYRGFLFDTGQLIGYLRAAEVRFDVEMLAGELEAAHAVADEAYARLLEKGDRWPYLGAFLAQARLGLGMAAGATEMADVAAASTNAVERGLGLGVLARVRAAEGNAPEAERLIAEAVAIVEQTDFLFDRGTVFVDQGEVWRLLGRAEASHAALERALGEFERKGDLVSSARARSLLER